MSDFWFLLAAGAFALGWTHNPWSVLVLVMWWYIGLILELAPEETPI